MRKIAAVGVLVFLSVLLSTYACAQQADPVREKVEKGLITFKGGGLTLEDAIQMSGDLDWGSAVKSEYLYLEKIYGPRGKGWNTTKYSSATGLIKKDGRVYDRLQVVFDDGRAPVFFYFEITSWFGKQAP